MKKFEVSMYYRDEEEFQDALERLNREVGEVWVRVVEACPMHSGGWPIVEVMMDESLAKKFAEWVELDEGELEDYAK